MQNENKAFLQLTKHLCCLDASALIRKAGIQATCSKRSFCLLLKHLQTQREGICKLRSPWLSFRVPAVPWFMKHWTVPNLVLSSVHTYKKEKLWQSHVLQQRKRRAWQFRQVRKWRTVQPEPRQARSSLEGHCKLQRATATAQKEQSAGEITCGYPVNQSTFFFNFWLATVVTQCDVQ